MSTKRKREVGSSKNAVVYRGITKIGERWRSKITIDGSNQHLGYFRTSHEAAVAYDRAAVKAGRPVSKLNFPEGVPKDYKPKRQKMQLYVWFASQSP